MKKIFFVSFLAIAALAACAPDPNPRQEESSRKAASVPSMENIFSVGASDYESNRVYVSKSCDHGRAIYVTSNNYDKAGGIAIVENAEECKNNP